jgi:hypothetical protein
VLIVMIKVRVWESRGHLSAHSDDDGSSMRIERSPQCS